MDNNIPKRTLWIVSCNRSTFDIDSIWLLLMVSKHIYHNIFYPEYLCMNAFSDRIYCMYIRIFWPQKFYEMVVWRIYLTSSHCVKPLKVVWSQKVFKLSWVINGWWHVNRLRFVYLFRQECRSHNRLTCHHPLITQLNLNYRPTVLNYSPEQTIWIP